MNSSKTTASATDPPVPARCYSCPATSSPPQNTHKLQQHGVTGATSSPFPISQALAHQYHRQPRRCRGPRAPSQRYSKSYLFSLYVSLFHTIHIISNLLGHNPYEFSVPITPLPVTCTHRSGVQQVVFVFCICLSFLYYAQYCEPTVPQFLRVFSTSQAARTSRVECPGRYRVKRRIEINKKSCPPFVTGCSS